MVKKAERQGIFVFGDCSNEKKARERRILKKFVNGGLEYIEEYIKLRRNDAGAIYCIRRQRQNKAKRRFGKPCKNQLEI